MKANRMSWVLSAAAAAILIFAAVSGANGENLAPEAAPRGKSGGIRSPATRENGPSRLAPDLGVDGSGAVQAGGAASSVLSFIPRGLHSDIRAHRNTTDLTPYLQAAIDAAAGGTLFFPQGTYHHTGLITRSSMVIAGASWGGTILANTGPKPSLTIASQPGADYLVGGVVVSDLQITGRGSGAGVLYDTQSHSRLSRIHILNVGGHGVQLGATQHVYGLTLDNCIVQSVGGDGVYGKGRSSQQVNAINVLNHTEINGAQNGINVWGVSINVKDAIIEENRGYGIVLSSSDAAGAEGSVAKSISVEGNYIEGNKLGNIYVEVGQYAPGVSKRVEGLTIRDNFLNGGGLAPGARNVIMKKVAVSKAMLDRNPYLSGVTFAGNTVAENPGNPGTSGVCDFGNALGPNSFVAPAEAPKRPGAGGAIDDASSRYLNLGLARFDLPARTISIPGLFFAKGDIVYSDTNSGHSESVALGPAPKRAAFPVLVPEGSVILQTGVHVESSSPDYNVEVAILQRDPRGPPGGWTLLATWTAAGQAGSKLIEVGGKDAGWSVGSRIRMGSEDLVLRIGVTGRPGTALRLGNPFVRFN
jgi:hypothetical protein